MFPVFFLFATAALADSGVSGSTPVSKIAVGMTLGLTRDLVIPADPLDPVYIQSGHLTTRAAVDFSSALCDFEVPAVSRHFKAGQIFIVEKIKVVAGGNMRESVTLSFRGDALQMNCESSQFELRLADFRDTIGHVFKIGLPSPKR